MTTFPSWQELSRRANDRVHQSVVVDGVEFVHSVEAARRAGVSTVAIHKRCDVAGDCVVLTGRGGLRFIRLPRHPSDERAPVYVDVRTI